MLQHLGRSRVDSIESDVMNQITRRALFQQSASGLGAIALSTLLANDGAAGTQPIESHLPARAKNVIFLHMVGAPSTLDLFEDKPVLRENDGQLVPDELWENLRLAFIRKQPKLLGSPFKFQKHGESGIEVSELLPHFTQVVDDVTMIKGVHTEQFNHAPAQLMFQTGFSRFGRPSLGSWVSYGLGTLNQNLPAFVVLITGQVAGGGNSLWGSGFLPSLHQGIEFRSSGDPVLFLSNPPGIKREDRRRFVDRLNFLNQQQLDDLRVRQALQPLPVKLVLQPLPVPRPLLLPLFSVHRNCPSFSRFAGRISLPT